MQQVPGWFESAVNTSTEPRIIEVQGANLFCRQWSSNSERGLLFVHGHAAHGHWWDFIAPAFQADFRVATLDLSGHGDSDHREWYGARCFAEEIAAAATALSPDTIVVAHSFGGSMARLAAHLHPQMMTGLVLVDSVIPAARGSRKPPPMPRQHDRFYPDTETAIRRFRLRPPQPCDNPYILNYIARHSVRETDNGVVFKLDPALFARMRPDPGADMPSGVEMMASLSIPSGLIYGELSRFFPPGSEPGLNQLFGPNLRCIEGTHHHLFLEQPQAFTAQLAELIEAMPRHLPRHLRQDL